MYQFLDLFFLVFHTSLILFNLLGWVWVKTRRLNFLTLSLTAFSWIVLGIWYGLGYCPCTHWHWLVRRKLGIYDMPDSYIAFLVEWVTGWQFDPYLIDVATGVCFLAAIVISTWLNFFSDGNRS